MASDMITVCDAQIIIVQPARWRELAYSSLVPFVTRDRVSLNYLIIDGNRDSPGALVCVYIVMCVCLSVCLCDSVCVEFRKVYTPYSSCVSL